MSLKTKEPQTRFESVAWTRKASMVIEMTAKFDISRLEKSCWPLKVCWRKAKEQCNFWFKWSVLAGPVNFLDFQLTFSLYTDNKSKFKKCLQFEPK